MAGEQRWKAVPVYFGCIANHCQSEQEVIDRMLWWNMLNEPLLPPEEVVKKTRSLWEEWRSYMKAVSRDEPSPVDLAIPRDEVERNLQDIKMALLGGELLKRRWKCITWRKILREDNHYKSLPFPCGESTCPWCADALRKQLILHLVDVAEKGELYFRHLKSKSWVRIVETIEKAKGDRVIIDGATPLLFTNRPVYGVPLIPSHVAMVLLEKIIPSLINGRYRPRPKIYASPSWTLSLDRANPNIDGVTTWFPLYRQQEIAVGLGAKSCGPYEWEAPAGANQMEWEYEFTRALGIRAKELFMRLYDLEKLDLKFYLNLLGEIGFIDMNISFYDTQPNKP